MKTLSLGVTYRHLMSTKRGRKVSGVIGDPEAHLSGVRCSYAMSVDPSGIVGLRQSEVIQTLTEVFHIFAEGEPDITEGDFVTVDGVEYVVRMSQKRPAPAVLSAQGYTRLTVERLQI